MDDHDGVLAIIGKVIWVLTIGAIIWLVSKIVKVSKETEHKGGDNTEPGKKIKDTAKDVATKTTTFVKRVDSFFENLARIIVKEYRRVK